MYSHQVNYNNQPTPAYSQMPPPPPFEESHLTPTGSHMDLAALDSPMYSSENFGTPVKVNLDLSKFKTKLCRHYSNGQACPFEDRCAFAHGFEEQAAARAAAGAMAPPPPAYHLATPTQGGSSGPSSDADLNEQHNEAAVESSRPSTPPAYPTRYRYDPYNLHTVMVFAQ